MRPPLPLPIALAVAVPVLLGGSYLYIIYAASQSNEMVEQVWPAPASAPAWAGYELVGVDIWGGMGVNSRVTTQALALRCTTQPKQRLEREYWPGADWAGHAEWGEGAVTYHPDNNNPKVEPYTFMLEEAQRRLGCGE